MNILQGPLIGKGNTADVFDIGNGRALKLFHEGYPKDSAFKEFTNAGFLRGLDIPVARSYEFITIAGRYGIVYDKVDGKSLLDILLDTQDIQKGAVILAQLHRKLLSQKLEAADDLLNSLRQRIGYTDKLSLQCKMKLYGVLETLPQGNQLCHGDFHFGNILVDGESYTVIDFMNICKGHEYGDIARTVYLTEMTPVPAGMPDKESVLHMKRTAADIYLKELGVSRESLSDWLTVTAAARLSELSDEQTEERSTVLKYLSALGY